MMDHFVWHDNFSIGVDAIDDQHKLFLDYVNECYNAACRDGQRQVTDATIYDLKVYSTTHFQFEEELMREKGYPDLEDHVKQHRYFKSQVAELERASAERSKRTVESLLQFLREWFLKHILEHDKKLAAFLKQRRLSRSAKDARGRS